MTRLLVQSVAETIMAASCSKNFGIYRERTGLLMVVSQDLAARGLNQGTLAYLNRQNFSFPPDHGARLVTMVLSDPDLRADWAAELEEVRLSMLGLREQLSEELQRLSGSDRFGFLAQHRGMFSRLGTTPDKVARLREEHALYMVAGGVGETGAGGGGGVGWGGVGGCRERGSAGGGLSGLGL